MSDLLGQAVRNNADWCGRICALHGAAGRMGYAAWVNEHPAPRYYPNVVTLRPDCGAAQMEIIARLDLPKGSGVKDSFRALDLAPLGFHAAIEGQWVRHTPTAGASDLDWRRIETPLALAEWETAWGGEGHRGHLRIFLPSILADDAITIFGGYAGEDFQAGGIVNLAAGVAGLSNLVAGRPELIDAAVAHAQTLAGDLSLVGWENDDAPQNVEVLGPLRVWLRDA